MSKSSTSRLRQERELRGWTQSEVAERIGSTRINVGRWEKGETVPGPYYRQKLAELFGKSIAELGFIPEHSEERNREEVNPVAESDSHISFPPAQPIYVPYRRNPFFTGREEILAHLYTVLRSSRTAALTQAQAISGLGGIGKTQIALEYAYRYRDHYKAIFWVNASTREALNTDFAALVAHLGLPEQYERDQDIVIPVVKNWLATHTDWLLILDNIDKPEMIVDFLPVQAAGDVLFTTRLQALGTFAQGIEVEKMGLDESVKFLLHRTKVLSPGSSLEQAPQENKLQAAEVFAALDGLPLALDQAGAYIEETHCGLSQYLNLFATRRKALLLRRGRYPINHPDSVAATWSLSFQQVEQECPEAVDLLNLFAFLNPESIPEEVIALGAAELGPTLETVASDPLQVNSIIELLLRYSLIRRNSEEESLSIHRLVQAVLKDDMDRDTQQMWAERAIRAVNQAFPDAVPQTREMCQRLLPLVHICATHSEEYSLTFPEAVHLFNKAASFLFTHGRYSQAEPLLLRVLAVRQHILEADHPNIASALNDLGALCLNRRKFKDAEPLLQRALAIRQQVLGKEHPDVAETFYNLANLYRAWGKYDQAEPFYLQAQRIREVTSGTDDPLTALSYYGLSRLYYAQEKYEQAEKFCERAFHIQEQRLGNEHPELASTLIILAKIYQGQQKLDLAKEMNIRALEIREKTSGEIQEKISGVDDPSVATIANDLAEIYHAEGRYREAEPWIERALSIHEQTLGWEHPYMAYTLNNLAENFLLQGDYSQAETYYKKAFAIREQHLGIDHPHTAFSYRQLGRLYSAVERHEEAESCNESP
ncbi:MAG: tetratricopeptide repeat protein [Ktedonobacteraceae bacterium]